MEKYQEYLAEKGYGFATKERYIFAVKAFLFWLEKKVKTVQEVDYKLILRFIKSRKEKQQSPRYINAQLRAVRYYYEMLGFENNPFIGILIKGTPKRLAHHLLSEKQLNALYLDKKTSSKVSFREREILGFLVYQGLKMGEIGRLKINDIDFEKGEVFIQGNQRINSRKLPLKAHQALNLQQYLESIQEEKSEFLFGKRKFVYQANAINQRLKKQHQISSLTLRSSVICNWLKQFNLREVQYKSGHKYVSSTEKYQKVNQQDLKEAILQFHPF